MRLLLMWHDNKDQFTTVHGYNEFRNYFQGREIHVTQFSYLKLRRSWLQEFSKKEGLNGLIP